jgi:hypothetical protein
VLQHVLQLPACPLVRGVNTGHSGFCRSTLWESLVKVIYTYAVIVLTNAVSLNYIFWLCTEFLKNISPSHFSIPFFNCISGYKDRLVPESALKHSTEQFPFTGN